MNDIKTANFRREQLAVLAIAAAATIVSVEELFL